MNKFYKYLLLVPGAVFAAMHPADAQNLNPTVEVSRNFEGKVLEAHKPMAEMAVPDSVMRFDIDFDYSVFDNPFKGAGGFNPYLLEMTPETSAAKAPLFYLKTGAGYGMRPELDAVFSPRTAKMFKFDVYARFNSYIGDYRTIVPDLKDNAYRLVSQKNSNSSDFRYADPAFHGHDMRAEAGLNGRWDWRRGSLSFGMGYEGSFAADSILSGCNMNGVKAVVRAVSKRPLPNSVYYDAMLYGRFATSKVSGIADPLSYSGDALHTKAYGAKLIVGPVMGDGSRILADLGADLTSYSGLVSTTSGNVHFTPKYELETGRWRMSLGLKLSAILGPKQYRNSQILYPEIHFGYEAVRERLNIFFNAVGGDNMNTYFSQRDANNFFDTYMRRSVTGWEKLILGNSPEQYNVSAGVQGNIATTFKYVAKVGYRSVKDGYMETVAGVALPYADLRPYLCPAGILQSYGQMYAQAAMSLDTKYVDFTADLIYRKTDIYLSGNELVKGFAPSPFRAFVRAEYSAMDRLFAGLFAEVSTRRHGSVDLYGNGDCSTVRIPGYVDLGLNARYMFNKKFGVWVEAANLLDMTIQRTPLYAQRGLSFTAGICLNL